MSRSKKARVYEVEVTEAVNVLNWVHPNRPYTLLPAGTYTMMRCPNPHVNRGDDWRCDWLVTPDKLGMAMGSMKANYFIKVGEAKTLTPEEAESFYN